MEYIACTNKTFKSASGQIEIMIGDKFEEKNGCIYKEDELICFKTSQNAYDLFARNDDNKGIKRYNLTREIIALFEKYTKEYNDECTSIINSQLSEEEKFEQLNAIKDKTAIAYDLCRKNKDISKLLKDNDNVWNFDFYNADVELLENTKSLVSNL